MGGFSQKVYLGFEGIDIGPTRGMDGGVGHWYTQSWDSYVEKGVIDGAGFKTLSFKKSFGV